MAPVLKFEYIQVKQRVESVFLIYGIWVVIDAAVYDIW
jgi:hypothetical protein